MRTTRPGCSCCWCRCWSRSSSPSSPMVRSTPKRLQSSVCSSCAGPRCAHRRAASPGSPACSSWCCPAVACSAVASGSCRARLTLFASALLTGGVGPWLPFQMLCAAWVGFLAGCLPRATGRRELWMLATYGAVAGLVYGLIMDMWFWPFGTAGTELHFVPGASVAENLRRFWAFHLASALGFDIPRALGNALLVLIVGTPVLAALRRAARRGRVRRAGAVRRVPRCHCCARQCSMNAPVARAAGRVAPGAETWLGTSLI